MPVYSCDPDRYGGTNPGYVEVVDADNCRVRNCLRVNTDTGECLVNVPGDGSFGLKLSEDGGSFVTETEKRPTPIRLIPVTPAVSE